MTLPGFCFVGFNPVTVRTSHNAFMPLDFIFDGLNRLELVDVGGFSFHMVDIQGRVMRSVPAVNTPMRNLIIRQPLLDDLTTIIAHFIYTLPVTWLLQTLFSPSLSLFSGRLRTRWSGAAGAKRRAILSTISLRKKDGLAVYTVPRFSGRIFPGRHT